MPQEAKEGRNLIPASFCSFKREKAPHPREKKEEAKKELREREPLFGKGSE